MGSHAIRADDRRKLGNPFLLWRVACLKRAAEMRPAGSVNMAALATRLTPHNVALMAQEKRLEGLLETFAKAVPLETHIAEGMPPGGCLLLAVGGDGHRTLPIVSVNPTPRKDGTPLKRTLYAVTTQEGEVMVASPTWVVFP